MMKVLHILNGLGVGGAEAFLKSLISALENDDVQMDFLLRTQNNNSETLSYFKDKGCKIFIMPPFPSKIFKNFKETAKFMSDNADVYDAVHIHANSLFYFFPINKAKKYMPKAKIIIHSHNTSTVSRLTQAVHFINKLRLKRYDCIRLACSEEAGSWMFKKSNFKVINNSVDISKFENSDKERLRLRNKYKINEKTLISVGRLEAQKNYLFLIPIIKKLAEKHPDIKLLICGDGILKSAIEKAICENGLENNIELLGNRSDVAKLLKASDIYLMPSLYEGLGIAAIEAQATGIPCILSDTVPLKTKICHNVSFLPLNCDLWVKKIENLFGGGYFNCKNSILIESAGFGLQGLRKQMKEVYLKGE